MRAFWRFLLRKNLPADSLSGVSFAAFGLGDSGKIIFYAAISCDRARPQMCQNGGDDVQLDLI